MKNENLSEVLAICKNRFDLTTEEEPMLDFQPHEGQYVQYRFNSFQAGKRNLVTLSGKPVMSALSLTVKESIRVSRIMNLPSTVDIVKGSFFHIAKGVNVPCHRDEEKHEGFVRNAPLLTFNVSGPKSVLYVNTTGRNCDYALLVSDYFITTLNPTHIFHGVIADPDEDLFLVQFPILPLDIACTP